MCRLTQGAEDTVHIAVVNALAQSRLEIVTFPVSSRRVTVTTPSGVTVPLQIYAADESVTNYRRHTKEAMLSASFVAHLPPLGVATYRMTVPDDHNDDHYHRHKAAVATLSALLPSSDTDAEAPQQQAAGIPTTVEHAAVGANATFDPAAENNGTISISNAFLELNFSTETGTQGNPFQPFFVPHVCSSGTLGPPIPAGRLTSMVNKVGGLSIEVDQSFCYCS